MCNNIIYQILKYLNISVSKYAYVDVLVAPTASALCRMLAICDNLLKNFVFHLMIKSLNA